MSGPGTLRVRATVSHMQWRRACENSACVEVAVEADAVLIRDSKDPDTVLQFTPGEWREFVAGVRAGEFS